MAFYEFSTSNKMGGAVDTGLKGLRSALLLTNVLASFNQMTDEQIANDMGMSAVSGGNSAVQQAAAFKAELASDVAQLVSVQAALNQLLAQTGY